MENTTESVPMSDPHVPTQQETAPTPFVLPKPKKLFTEAWALFKNNWKYLVRMCVIGMLFMCLAMLPAILILVIGGASNVGILFIIGIILLLIPVYVGLWFMVSFVRAVALLVDEGKTLTTKEFFSAQNRPFIWKYFWLRILVGIIVFAGFILFIVPGVIFATWFSFASFVLIFEGTKITEALTRSKSYVKGRTGAVLWRWIYVGLVQILFFIGLAIIVAIIPGTAGEIVDFIGQLVLNIVWMPLLLIYGYMFYKLVKNNPVTK